MQKQTESSEGVAQSDATHNASGNAAPPESDTSNPIRTEESNAPSSAPKEYGGRKGPDPVRYGDWEKNGRCIDF